MAETTADVRRDIELTRDRLSETLQQLEQKTNVMQIVRDHPWPALAAAVGAGVLLSGSGTDIKAAAATATATRGASSRLGTVLDDVVANLMGGLSVAFQDRVESLVNELKEAIGAPTSPGGSTSGRGLMGSASPASAAGATGAAGSAGSSSGASFDRSGFAGGAASGTGGSSGAWAPQSASSDDRPSGPLGDTAGSSGPLGSTVGADAGRSASTSSYSTRAD
jgi:hypothetical protein